MSIYLKSFYTFENKTLYLYCSTVGTAGSSFIWLTKPVTKFGENMEINNTSVKYYSNQEPENTPDMTSNNQPRATMDTEPVENGHPGEWR